MKWNVLRIALVLLPNFLSADVGQKNHHYEHSDSGKVKIEYIAHACFILTHNENSILLDPFADKVWIGYSFPKNLSADAIFSTHPHYDHDGGIFRNLHPYWEGTMPFYQDPGEYEIGSFMIRGLKGKHCDPYGKEFDQKNTIFIFEVGGLRIAHWGDNGPITDMLAHDLENIDILMLPIDDEFHILKAAEIEEILFKVDPKLVIPMHYKISALEPVAGKPEDLGTIDVYFRNIEQVDRLETNIIEIGPLDLPNQMQYMIFPHSPKVRN